MARAWNRLSANFVRGVRKRGRYADGGNLHLQVAKHGTKAWVLLYTRAGISRAMGLGSARVVSLALARELAAQAREQLARGIDPVDARKAAAAAQRAARAKLTTFQKCAEDYHSANKSRWRNEKHRREWLGTLRRYAFPILGHLSVNAIDTGLVHKTLLPLVVAKKLITAGRVRGRIETVLDFANAAGLREGDNPADKAVIVCLLPLRSEKAAVAHQPALPFAKLPALMAKLRTLPGATARQLEATILTGMRSGAVRPARFDEFDLAAGVWVVPQGRMKTLSRDHRIPLGPRMRELVQDLRDTTDGEYVFGGTRPGSKKTDKVLARLLQAIGHDQHAVAHGFRSCLKDWCHETRDYPSEVIEQALGHRIKSGVERAYRRGDLFDRRKVLMLDWESYCNGDEGGGVVRLWA